MSKSLTMQSIFLDKMKKNGKNSIHIKLFSYICKEKRPQGTEKS